MFLHSEVFIHVLQSYLFQSLFSVSSTAWAVRVEFTPSGLFLRHLMLKASLCLSWSFFKTSVTHMLRSACSGMWHQARFKQWDSYTLLEMSETVKHEIGAHLWHSSLGSKVHTLKMENQDTKLQGTVPNFPCPRNISEHQAQIIRIRSPSTNVPPLSK